MFSGYFICITHHVDIFRTWKGNFNKVGNLFDSSAFNDHNKTHITICKKKKELTNFGPLELINLDMSVCTALKQIPHRFWESEEFSFLAKHIMELGKSDPNALASLQATTKRMTRARRLDRFSKQIDEVNNKIFFLYLCLI